MASGEAKPIFLILETATYVNSSNYEYDGKQTVGDTWLMQADDTIHDQTYSRGNCVLLKKEYFRNQSCKILFY